MTNPFTKLKSYIIEKTKVDKQRLEQWVDEVINEDSTPSFYDFVKLRCVENSKPEPTRPEDKETGRVYGTTSVSYDDNKPSGISVSFYIDNYMDYYEEVELEYAKFCFELEFCIIEVLSFKMIDLNNTPRWIIEFLYRKSIRSEMKKKIRRTVLHEYRHTEQFMFLIDNNIDIHKVVEDDDSVPYGKGVLEKDAIRYSEDKIDIPLDQVFVHYME